MNPCLHDLLDRAVADGGLPGIVVEVRDGDRAWSATAGVGDTTTRRPRQPEDHFRIGSMTKSFVATVVLGLVGEGLLGLGDSVKSWLPGVIRGYGDDITVRHLLNHTSGTVNYTDDMQRLSGYATYTPGLLVEIATDHPPAFAPGTDWGYSNTNYVLLGLIAERAAGAAVDDLIQTRIATGLGLTGTYLPVGDDPTLRHLTHGTTRRCWTRTRPRRSRTSPSWTRRCSGPPAA